ncbi:MAG TPA: CARDB domain-containing protein, partial [Chloroflexota bacterium]|nr:CARDB domain-containing protein [Chloroflexota bacterium]
PGVTPSRTPTQGPRADLQVTDFAVASGAADVLLPVNITVRNGGSQDAGPFDVHVYADTGPGSPAPRLITPHWGLSGLASGLSVTLAGTIEPGTLAAGPHVLFGQADGHDLILETTKGNNVQSVSITVSQPGSTIPTFTPAPTHTQGPTPTATPPAPGGSTTVTFGDRPGQSQPLNGQYPASLIDWGSGQWYHAGPWGALPSKSASFTDGRTSSSFSFPGTGRLLSLRAYNGGESATTVALACAGNPTRTQSVPAGQVATISTGWTVACGGPVTLTSSNGWETNFDDLVVDATEDDGSPPPASTAVASPTRAPTRTPTPTPQPTATPVPQTLTFDSLSGADQLLGGQYPAGVIDWGSGQWYLSGPWEDFSSKSVSFTEGRTSAGITFLTPRRLLSVRAHNGGAGPSTVALACSGQATAQVVVGAGQTATLSTGWKTPCTSVSFSSSNGWETNFDDLVIDGP